MSLGGIQKLENLLLVAVPRDLTDDDVIQRAALDRRLTRALDNGLCHGHLADLKAVVGQASQCPIQVLFGDAGQEAQATDIQAHDR